MSPRHEEVEHLQVQAAPVEADDPGVIACPDSEPRVRAGFLLMSLTDPLHFA